MLDGGAWRFRFGSRQLLSLLQSADPFSALSPFWDAASGSIWGVRELQTVMNHMAAFGVPASHYRTDLTIARGLDYYTGTVYETVMLDHPEIVPSARGKI